MIDPDAGQEHLEASEEKWRLWPFDITYDSAANITDPLNFNK